MLSLALETTFVAPAGLTNSPSRGRLWLCDDERRVAQIGPEVSFGIVMDYACSGGYDVDARLLRVPPAQLVVAVTERSGVSGGPAMSATEHYRSDDGGRSFRRLHGDEYAALTGALASAEVIARVARQ